MNDKTGEVWEATHLGPIRVVVVVSSNFEHNMHRLLVLELGPDDQGLSRWSGSAGEIVNIGDWDDRNELWKRIA